MSTGNFCCKHLLLTRHFFIQVVGIIDYLRQYDLIKKAESAIKSTAMIAGREEPTVIQPSHYKNRFQMAMERYFSAVPDKFSCFDL